MKHPFWNVTKISLLVALILGGEVAGIGAETSYYKLFRAIAGRIMSTAAGQQATPALTPADFTTLGITGVTPENLPSLLQAIEATADDGTGVNSPAKIQALVNRAATQVSTAVPPPVPRQNPPAVPPKAAEVSPPTVPAPLVPAGVPAAGVSQPGGFNTSVGATRDLTHHLRGREQSLNRFSLAGKFSFLISSDFSSATPPPSLGTLTASGATVPSTATDRIYDDGFVRTDISGNAGGQTWFWGYNDPSQLAGIGTATPTLSLHSAPSLADQATRRSEESVQSGFSLSYSRVLHQWEIRPGRVAAFGVSGSFGYTDLHLRDAGLMTGTVPLTTDTYNLDPNLLPPPAPFAGTFVGPGGLIPDNPNGGRVTVPVAATASLINRLEGGVYAFSFGPFGEVPLTDRVFANFSAGLAVAAIDRTYTYSELATAFGAPAVSRSGSTHAVDWLVGATVQTGLEWTLTDHWSVGLAGQFQFLGHTEQTVQGKTARLNLSTAISALVSLNYGF